MPKKGRGRSFSNDSRASHRTYVSQKDYDHLQRQIQNIRDNHKKQNNKKQNKKGPAKKRPAYKGKKPYETKKEGQKIGFAMVQMPTPKLDKDRIKKLHGAYELYHTDDAELEYVWPDSRGALTAFQSATLNNNAPMTIVASKLVEEEGVELFVDKLLGQATVKHVPYKTWKYDSINNTFLFYVGGANVDKIFDVNVDEAPKGLTGTCYLFYSMALYAGSRGNEKKKFNIYFHSRALCSSGKRARHENRGSTKTRLLPGTDTSKHWC
jgi:hypothetical protein